VRASDDRERLIEVGLDVCLLRGYEKTTVGDIAAAAGVSEDALTEEFATTEAIVMAPVDAMLAAPDKHGRFDPRDDARNPDRMRDRFQRAFRHITGR
jgi:AcrR family transcriptional regulator